VRAPAVPILRVLDDTAIGRFLREAHNFFTALRDLPRLWGERVSVTFDAPSQVVNVVHGLGRVPTGYVVEGMTTATLVYDAGNPTETVLPLTCTSAGTVRLWIY
jgi:hypothetical protein